MWDADIARIDNIRRVDDSAYWKWSSRQRKVFRGVKYRGGGIA